MFYNDNFKNICILIEEFLYGVGFGIFVNVVKMVVIIVSNEVKNMFSVIDKEYNEIF